MMGLDKKKVRKILFYGVILCIILLSLLAYLHYLDLKKAFITKISAKLTSMIGQRVYIEDLSISPSGVITLYNITIENPESFAPGQLLWMKRLSLDLRVKELIEGKFIFKNIILFSPELYLVKDKKGHWNISDVLLRLLSEKSTGKYQYRVDEFRIDSGVFDFNRDETYRSGPINLRLGNLSSDTGTRTKIQGAIVYAGNKIQLDGWAFLNEASKKFNLSLSSNDVMPSSIGKLVKSYKIDAQKTRINISLHAEGDMEKGFHITSDLHLKKAGFFLLKGEEDLRLLTDATFSFQDYSITIRAISLHVNGVSKAVLKGVVTGLKKKPTYRAELKIDRLDLSGLHFMKDLKVSGILTSNNIRLAGSLETKIPEVSGTLQLREGGIESHQAVIRGIDADIIFSSNKEISMKGEASARIEKVGEYLFIKPVETKLLTTLQNTQDRMAFTSFLTLSPLFIKIEGGKTASLDSSNMMIDGTMEGKTFSGKNSFEIKSINYGDYTISGFRSNSDIHYQKGGVIVKNLVIEAENVKSSANQMSIAISGGKDEYQVDIMDMNASYRNGEALLQQCDFHMNLHPEPKSISGDLHFSAKNIIFQGMTFSRISGNGRFDEKYFFIDIPQAETFKGLIKLTAQGKTKEGPFPIKTNFLAEGIDLAALSKLAQKSLKLPYQVAGNIKRMSFEGIINPEASLMGHAFFEANKVSVSKPDAGRSIVKDGLFHGEIEFKEKDLVVKGDGATGTLSTQFSGTVKEFMREGRQIQVKVSLPEVKVSEIRNAFWDIFPDSLLYTGLQGFISSDVSVDYNREGLEVRGDLKVKDCIFEGENGEYSIGPINGTIPIGYGKGQDEKSVVSMPSFEKSQFDQLDKYYAGEGLRDGSYRITIGSLTYGFPLLDNISLWIKQKGSILSIGSFSANIFGGKLNGSAIIDFSNGFYYRAGLLVKDVSLSKLCDGIGSIKGYISGRMNGIANLKGTGMGISQLIGKADFWTYRTRDEKTMISKTFLQKIGGTSMKAYLGDRPFDKGIMSLYLKNGYFIFEELEISNKNFLGITDLSVKVAPFNNRIALDHLLWTITEAAQRAKEKQ